MKTRIKKTLMAFIRYLLATVSFLFMFILIILICRFFIISPGRVDGKSMEPNFIDNELFFVNKYIYWWHQPARYDVVQVIDPRNNNLYVKRIIGLPGEVVVIKRGKVYIKRENDQEERLLDESRYLRSTVYTTRKNQYGAIRVLVPTDYYYVLGDNRQNSSDSREWGPIHRSDIIGRVIQLKTKDR